MSYIHNLKFITLEPPSGYKRNYILMKFHTSVYLEVLNMNFVKSFGGAVGKFPLDRENGPFTRRDSSGREWKCSGSEIRGGILEIFLTSQIFFHRLSVNV